MTEEKMDVLLAVFRTRQFRLGLLGGAALLFGWTWRRKANKGKQGEEDSGKGKEKGKEERTKGKKGKQKKEKEKETKEEETAGTSGDGAGNKEAESEDFVCKVASDGLEGGADDLQAVAAAGAEVHAAGRHPLVLAGSEDGVKPRSVILERGVADSGERAAEPAVCAALGPYSPQKEVVKEVTEAEPRDVGLVEGKDVEEERTFGSSEVLADLHVHGSGAEYGEDGGSSDQKDIFAVSSVSEFEDGDVRGGERDIEEVTSRTTSPAVDVVFSGVKAPDGDVAFLVVKKENIEGAAVDPTPHDEEVEDVSDSPHKKGISDVFSQQENGDAESPLFAADNLSKDTSDNRVAYVQETADTKGICCGRADEHVDGGYVPAADLLSKATPAETASGFDSGEVGEKAAISVPEAALEEAGKDIHPDNEGVNEDAGVEAVQDSQYDEKDGQGGQQDLTVCDSVVEVGVDAGIPDTEFEQNERERDEADRSEGHGREEADQSGGHGREEADRSEVYSSKDDRDLEEDFGETGFVENEEDFAGLVGSGEDFAESDGGYAEVQVNPTLEHTLNLAPKLDLQQQEEPAGEWTPEGSGAEETTLEHVPEQASSDSLKSVSPAARVHPVFRSNVDGENASFSSSEEKHAEDDLDYVYQDGTAAEEASSIQPVQSTTEPPVAQSPERVNNGLQLDRYDQLLADPKLPPALRSQVLRAKAALQKFYEGNESGSSCGYSSSA